jgi:hypothetical protein
LKTDPDASFIQCEIINIHAGAENRPQSTFSFSALFVNPISSVSTGFFRFFSVLSEIRFILPQKPTENALFSKSEAKSRNSDQREKAG